ncbi:MAG: bacterioferritin [Gammaproteobacteria bacterium]|nr:bacterioferritin [Gammaproteobacteria bacterium]
MKGKQKVIEQLNLLLAGELAAMDQYFIHSRMYEDMGFNELYERISHEFEEEKDHADWLIRRLLFLEGIPDMVSRSPINIGKDVPSMLQSDLELEYQVVTDLKAAILVCEQEQDYQSREILEKMLADTEEDHAYWLEQQLGLIDKVGLQNYLQAKM